MILIDPKGGTNTAFRNVGQINTKRWGVTAKLELMIQTTAKA
jgi:hypothetical protein